MTDHQIGVLLSSIAIVLTFGITAVALATQKERENAALKGAMNIAIAIWIMCIAGAIYFFFKDWWHAFPWGYASLFR